MMGPRRDSRPDQGLVAAVLQGEVLLGVKLGARVTKFTAPAS